MSDRLVLHEFALSGNCYKVRLTAAYAGVPIERREYDIMKGQTRTPEFLSKVSANGRIPVLQAGKRFIPESNAISFYVADGSALIPADRADRADMLHWMFWEQYHHEPNIATLRFWMRWLGLDRLTDLQRSQMPVKRKLGTEALQLMDQHLSGRKWFVGDALSLADICLFAYTHVADEADFDLALYPNVIEWMERIMTQPGHIPMEA
jgi:glutathione S-transferase